MKSNKLRLKAVLVAMLAVVLTVVCVSATTFSWFDPRPNSEEGNALSLAVPFGDKAPGVENETLPMMAYDGSSITMKTYLSTDDAIHFDDNDAPPATEGTLEKQKRNYYKTEITNGGTTDQRVSLYIKNFKPGGEPGVNICVGTNKPVKSFRNYSQYDVVIPSPAGSKAKGTTKRVYFDPLGSVPAKGYDAHRTTWGESDFWVRSGSNVDSGTFTEVKMIETNKSGVYYADIPVDDNQLYICCANSDLHDYQRTQTFTKLNGDGLSSTNSLLFYTNGTYTDYNNAWAGKKSTEGASFGNYFSSVSLYYGANPAQSISVGLTQGSGKDYCGTSISYEAKDYASAEIFSVDSSGVITPKKAGKGTLLCTVTSDSEKEDTAVQEVEVNVIAAPTSTTTIKNAPIVTNLLIEKGKTESVWWFIQNGDDSYAVSSGTGTYELAGIYIGL